MLSAEDSVPALEHNVWRSVRRLQEELRRYRELTGGPPRFVVHGECPVLPDSALSGARLYPSRSHALRDLPTGLRAIEVGTQRGEFASEVMHILSPHELVLVDISYELFEDLLFDSGMLGRITKLVGDSREILPKLQTESFDFVYVDGGHDYEVVESDIRQAARLLTPGGHMGINDITNWSPLEAVPYGVMKAAFEFLCDSGFQVSHFAFHPMGYHDIFLRKPVTPHRDDGK